VDEILGNCQQSQQPSETEASAPKSLKKETTKTRLKPSAPSVPPVLKLWLEYCDKNSVKYAPSNIKYWTKKLEKRVTIEQKDAVYTAINSGWKDFYVTPIKESKYHKFLGKSLMMDRDCDTLIDISMKDKQFIYQFKNVRVLSPVPPFKLFNRYGYDKKEVKTAPIVGRVKETILGMVKRF